MTEPSPPGSEENLVARGRSESVGEGGHGPHGSKISLLPLVALIYFEVAGGPYGLEGSVQDGGPLLAIIGFIVFPFIWSIPEALITAELGTAFPENGGYVVWVSAAFGPYWGFQEGWWKWLSGVFDNSLYPILFLDYIKDEVPQVSSGAGRIFTLIAITAVLTYLNYRGLTIVGATAMFLTVFGLLPFVILAGLAIPKLKPSRWGRIEWKTVNWRGYLNNLFWNLNYWDSVSTLAGEVHKPQKNFPRALFCAVILVVLAYLVPLLSGTGAIPFSSDQWDDGYLSNVGKILGGAWLFWWIAVAAALSNMGLFEAEMSSDSFQLLGMAERGMLPEVFAYRSKHGTPTVAILCSASGVVLLSFLSFDEIVELLNFLYCFGMLLEFAAFIALRIYQPNLQRPYKVPVGTIGISLMCLVPSVLLITVMCLATVRTIIFSFSVAFFGLFFYPFLMYTKKRKWLRFVVDTSLPEIATLEPLVEDAEGFVYENETGSRGDPEDDSILFVSYSDGGVSRRSVSGAVDEPKDLDLTDVEESNRETSRTLT